MPKHTFVVSVDCADQQEGHTVMAERLGHDEDYGFPYTLDYDAVSADAVATDDEFREALLEVERSKYRDSNDAEIENLGNALDLACRFLGVRRPELSGEEIEDLENA